MNALLSTLFRSLSPLWGMSLSAAYVAAVVVLLRLILKKRAQSRVLCLLWLVVFARLLIPISLESPLSILPDAGQVQWVQNLPAKLTGNGQPSSVPDPAPAQDPAPSVAADPVFRENAGPAHRVSDSAAPTAPQALAAFPGQTLAAGIWLAGVLVMVFYGLVSYLRLKVRLRDAVRAEDGAWEHPSVCSPFILGVIRPRIYFPVGLHGMPREFILCHEQAHLRRLDHIVKPVCWTAVVLHWFNPAVWIAFILMSRDIEDACDEAVIRQLGPRVKADYSTTLLSLATNGRVPAPCPLAFGEGNTKRRIQNVLRYRRPALWIMAVSVIMIIAAAVCLLTDPIAGKGSEGEPDPQVSASKPPENLADALPDPPMREALDEEQISLQKAAGEKLEGYLWPRESIWKNIMGKETEFILYHGNGWTIHVPASWEEKYAGEWQAPSQCACFSVSKQFLGVNNPKWYRAQLGAWRYETNYAPPFDYYYDDDGGYTPPAGSADYIYFFAPAGERQSYEFTLQTVVGATSEEEKLIQEAMLLSFCLDDSSHVLNSGEYAPGKTEWEAAIAGLAAETERCWFSWYHDGTLIETDGKGRPDYLPYALALEDFYPEEFIETFFGEKPDGAEELGGDPITLCLPEMGIWLYFYDDSSWVCIHHAGEDYWARFYHQDDPNKMIFDTVYAWLEAENTWALNGGA